MASLGLRRSRVRRFWTAVRQDPTAVVATATWALRAVVAVRRGLRRRLVASADLPRVPHASEEAEIVVNGVLRATRSTCLTRAIVRQRWFAARGDLRDLFIGVTSPRTGFRAHAWVAGDPDASADAYTEILRRRPDEPLVPPVDESVFD